jgi:hypothetical protein
MSDVPLIVSRCGLMTNEPSRLTPSRLHTVQGAELARALVLLAGREGRARAAALSPEQRLVIAQKAVAAGWESAAVHRSAIE